MLPSEICLFDVCIQFSHGFGWPRSYIWWGMIRCHLFFWYVSYLMPYCGIFHFRRDLWTLMELHGHHHLLDTHLDVDMFVTLSWHLSGASSDPFSQTLIFRHLVVVMFLIPRDVPYMFGFDLDHRDHMFDDRWFRVTWLLTYSTFDAILGHISILDEIYRSWWSCMLIPTCEMYIETMIYSLFFTMIP